MMEWCAQIVHAGSYNASTHLGRLGGAPRARTEFIYDFSKRFWRNSPMCLVLPSSPTWLPHTRFRLPHRTPRDLRWFPVPHPTSNVRRPPHEAHEHSTQPRHQASESGVGVWPPPPVGASARAGHAVLTRCAPPRHMPSMDELTACSMPATSIVGVPTRRTAACDAAAPPPWPPQPLNAAPGS